MYPKNPLFQKCLTCLESLPNINIKAAIQEEPYFSSEVLADGQLIINTPHATANYVCEIKTGITNEVVENIAEYFINLSKRLKDGQKTLLITRNLSSLVVDELFARNIEFIDVDGNIYLNNPQIYVVVRNQISKVNPNKSLEITTASLQVMYFLLKNPEINLIEGNEGQIAHISYLSQLTLKTVKSTLEKLQKLGYIRLNHKGYEIINYLKLLERWELGYFEKLRTRLLIGTFSPIGKQNFSEIEDELKQNAHNYGYLIGGELGASIMTQYLRPIGATLHINKDRNYRQIIINLKLKPDPNGSIELRQRFDYQYQANYFQELNCLVDPLLIHVELVHIGNSRLKETAQLIYDKYIEDIAQKHDNQSREASFI